MVAKTQEFHKRTQKARSLMKAKWYLIGAIALGVIVFLYLFLWCADPCH
jgi:predicted secreted protein